MSLKKFLKPTTGKFIIFVILEIPLLFYYYKHAQYVIIAGPCDFFCELFIRWIEPLIAVIPISFVLYLVGCFFVQIYNKHKNSSGS
jgi:hypothetical protein